MHRPISASLGVGVGSQGLRFCEGSLFRTRVYGLLSFAALQIKDLTPRTSSAPLPKATKDPQELASQIFIGQMTASQLVTNSPNTSITISYDVNSTNFKELIEELKNAIPKLSLDKTNTDQMYGDVGTIQVQMALPTPKKSIITESLCSIRNILENAAGSMLASALLVKLLPFIGGS
jgi:hypothetical protein